MVTIKMSPPSFHIIVLFSLLSYLLIYLSIYFFSYLFVYSVYLYACLKMKYASTNNSINILNLIIYFLTLIV
jgi:hypothetical protein